MSRLVFEGDLNKNFGEFFPTPYIDKIIVENATSTGGNPGTALTPTVSLLFTVPEQDPALPNREIDFVQEILERIKVNILITKSDQEFSKSTFYPSEYLSGRFTTYQQKTGVNYANQSEQPTNELSLLLYDPSILPILMTENLAQFPDLTKPPDTREKIEKESISPYGVAILPPFDPDETGKGMTYELKNVPISFFTNALNSGNYSFQYDRTGRRIMKLTAELDSYEVYVAHLANHFFGGYRTKFSTQPTLNFLAFTSLQTADEMRESGLRTNTALKLLVGDVAYENVLHNGAIANQTSQSFFDDNGDIYVETPIQALNSRFYKADSTTHQDMYDKFNQLIQQYLSLLPSVPEDALVADPELMGSIEVIQNILQTHKNKIDFLKQMVNARNLIINRSSGTRSGALYADMGTIIGRADEVVVQGTPLTKKLSINAKILDFRTGTFGELTLPAEDPADASDLFKIIWGRTIAQGPNDSGINIAQYLSDLKERFAGIGASGLGNRNREIGVGEPNVPGVTGETTITYNENGTVTISYETIDGGLESITLDDPKYKNLFEDEIYGLKEEKNITFGYALFDWETALMKNSTLSTLVDMERFRTHFGLQLAQRYFVPENFELIKYTPQPYMEDMEGGFVLGGASPGALPWETKLLTFTKAISKWYTEFEPEEYVPATRSGEIIHHPLPGPMGIPLEGHFTEPDRFTVSSGRELVIYATERNVDALPTETVSESDRNHKFFAIEFQTFDDACLYMNYDHPVIDNYECIFTVADYTKSALVDIIKHYYYLIETLKNYLVDASLECSYNNVDGRFNDFFAEAMTRTFASNPAAAPYVFCVVAYIKHVDFIFNEYNNDQTRMLLAAREIIQRISPQTGTLDQLKAFYNQFLDLYETYYSPSSVIGQKLIDLTPFDDYSHVEYGLPLRVERTFSSGLVSATSISAQNEVERDSFLETIDYHKSRFEEASAAYAEALGVGYLANAERIKQLFENRDAQFNNKLNYEARELQNTAGNCKFAWWWDGWTTDTGFSDAEPTGDDSFGTGQNKNWDKIDPNGVCEGLYGYVWVKGADKSKVVDWYDVNTYGEPSVFANYRRDRTTSGVDRCRYIKRAYRVRASDFRLDSDHERQIYDEDGSLANKFGGYYGEPSGKVDWSEDTDAGYYYSTFEEQHASLRGMIKGLEQGEDGNMYRRRMPGYELIRNYDNYAQYVADAEAGIDRLDYTPFVAENRDPSWGGAFEVGAPGIATPYGAALTDTENWSEIWYAAYDPARQGIVGWNPEEYGGGRGASYGGPDERNEPDEYSEGDYG